MGIYIFTAEKLFKYLELDNQSPNSENDFGKNVLPAMLKTDNRFFTDNYVFVDNRVIDLCPRFYNPELTKVRSMGSIPFGGRYRIVDFALSNMVNSGSRLPPHPFQ